MRRGRGIPGRPSAATLGKAFGMLRARKRAGVRNPKPETRHPDAGNGIGIGQENGKS